MSFVFTNLVWEHSRATGAARFVLVALADHADDGGWSHPSVGRLAARCGMTARGVRKSLAALVALGELRIEANSGPRGCNRFLVTLAVPPGQAARPARPGATPRGAEPGSGGVNDVPGPSEAGGGHRGGEAEPSSGGEPPSARNHVPSPPEPRSAEPSGNRQGSGNNARAGDGPEQFDPMPDPAFEAFWAAYPRKAAKDDARNAFHARNLTPILPQVLAAVAAQRRGIDWTKQGGRFIPFPATWIHRGSWQDEVLAARLLARNGSARPRASPEPSRLPPPDSRFEREAALHAHVDPEMGF